MSNPSLDALRRFAVGRSLFQAVDLHDAIQRFGFLQADPIRAPARAQDLTLRHRVTGYLAGDLERRYATLPIEEAFFVNYGFVTRRLHALMHPRGRITSWATRRRAQAEAILAYVRERGSVHPREVDAHFAHGRVTNYWGGSSNASTHMLDQLHYLGLLRVARRDAGIRVYGAREPEDATLVRLPTSEIDARLDALVGVIVAKYAPLPWASLTPLIRRLRYAVPQWQARIPRALERAVATLVHARVDGVAWCWPADATIAVEIRDEVRLLAPFDPIVWDRRRFELLWGWAYRFEAYTPLAKRQLGYYALPLLWRDRVIGWGNAIVTAGVLRVEIGYVSGKRPRDRGFTRELEIELDRLRAFLDVTNTNAKRRTLEGPALRN
ncbi:MAG: crosslink repair DNA glycosylase YcaQ family protein, partial [Vicinamibacterales bacterium]